MNKTKMRSMKRLLSALLLVCMVFTLVAPTAAAIDDDMAGDGLTETPDERYEDPNDQDNNLAIVFVGPQGDDRNAGTEAEPVATIKKAYDLVSDGGTIVVHMNLWITESVMLDQNKNITLMPYDYYIGDTRMLVPMLYTGTDLAGDAAVITVANGNVEFINLKITTYKDVDARGLCVSGGNVILSDCTIMLMHCSGNGAGVLVSGGALTLRAGTITNNISDSNGGGIYIATGASLIVSSGGTTSISRNTAAFSGGGIYIESGGNVKINNAQSNVIMNTAMHDGAGIYLADGAICELGNKISVKNNTTSNDRQSNIYVGNTLAITNSITGTIGFIADAALDKPIAVGSSYQLRESDIANFSYDVDGADYDLLLQDNGIVIMLNDTGPAQPDMSDTVYVSAAGDDNNAGTAAAPVATIEKAYALVNDGGVIVLQNDLQHDAVMAFADDKAVTLQGSGVTVTYIGTDPINNDQAGFLTVQNGSVRIEGVTIQLPDTYGTNGRPLYVGGGTVTLGQGAAIANGYLAYSGGGVLIDGGRLVLETGSSVRNNYVGNNTAAYGGGVYVKDGTLRMDGGEVQGNTIHTMQDYASYGGGIAVGAAGRLELYGGTITGNAVDTDGGGLYVVDGAEVVLSGAITIDGNTADQNNNNLYLPTDEAVFSLFGAVTGKIGVTHGAAEYWRIIGVPDGYTIQVSDESPFYYDDGTYDIRLKNGNLVLYWFTVSVDHDGDNLTSTNTDTETETGKDYETKLEPDNGYQLPPEITITVDGQELDENQYTYDPDTGAVTIPGENVTGDIVISADGNKEYTITIATENATTDSADTVVVVRQDETIITITPDNRYAMPDTVTVDGTCTWDYDSGSGVLRIEDVQGDITVSISGAEIPHKIYFDPTPGQCDTEYIVINESQKLIGTLPVPIRTGYTFKGWFTDGGTRVTAETENHMTDDLHLTAEWAQDTNIAYKVQHWLEYVDSGVNPEYIAGETETTTMTYGGVETLYYLHSVVTYNDGISDHDKTINDLLLDSLGELDIAGVTPSKANEYNVTMQPDGSSIFPFFYDRGQYVVTFDPNGGAINPDDMYMDVTYGSIYGQLPGATRTGYTLMGWYTEAKGGTQVAIDDVYLVAGNQTLYAHWRPTGDTKYQVVHMTQIIRGNLVGYDKTDANYQMYTTANETGPADATVDVYSITIPGFVPSAENTYQTYIAADGTTTHLIYYDRISTTVKYDAQGGTAAPYDHTIYYGGYFTGLPVTSRIGHDFSGWWTSPGAESQRVTQGTNINDINPKIKTEITLYAHWTSRTYQLDFVTHDGDLIGDLPKTVTYGQAAGELPVAELTGYTFKGWYSENTFLGTPNGIEITADTVITEDNVIVVGNDGSETTKTLYAHYEPIKVTITFDPDGGTLSGSKTKDVYYNQLIGALPTPSMRGHTSSGWFFADGTQLKADDKSKLLQDVTVTAKWVPDVYKITLDVNGGKAIDPDYISVTYGKTFNGLPTPTRDRYSFDGWFTSTTGGTQYTNGMAVTITGPITLYAQWTSNDTGGNTGGGNTGGGGGGGGTTTYTITATADTGANITPDGDTKVTAGNNQAYTIAAKAGYTITDVLVDGESIGAAETYTFENVRKNHTIHVAAEKNSMLTGDHIAYISGYTDGTVRPNANITRAETAMIFYRLLTDDARAAAGRLTFSDVHTGDWYADAVKTLAGAGIITGYPDGTFRPNQTITRAEFATIATRFDDLAAASGNLFTDIAGHWAADSINRAANKGWITGYPDGTFRPDQFIIRAEAVTLVNAVLERKVDAAGVLPDMLTFSDNLDASAWYYYAIQEAANGHDYTKDDKGMETWTVLY